MEYLTNSLNEVINKLDDDQKEEINFIESIIAINKYNKEKTKEKVFSFIKKSSPEDCGTFTFKVIAFASTVRPKERRYLQFIVDSVLESFFEDRNDDIIGILDKSEQVFPCVKNKANIIFDFDEEGTIGKSIFEDDIDQLKELLINQIGEKNKNQIDVSFFFARESYPSTTETKALNASALFGSNKCFKYLLMNGEEIEEETCMFAIAGGNLEIIHLCEQKGMKFENCLELSARYHRFDLFEWLENHYEFKQLSLVDFTESYNEPLIYFFLASGMDIIENDMFERTLINVAFENGNLELIKYLFENYDINIEFSDEMGNTPINSAAQYGHLGIIKYLFEKYHPNIESKNDWNLTPIYNAMHFFNNFIAKYLVEKCGAIITNETLGYARTTEIKRYLQTKLQENHI